MHDLIIKQGLYSCLYIYMHMHCCLHCCSRRCFSVCQSRHFIYSAGTSLRLISISFLISIFTFFHKNHGSIRHSRTMPPNASKTVFGEYPISHTHACSLTRSGSRKYPIASSSFSSLYIQALTVAFFSLSPTRPSHLHGNYTAAWINSDVSEEQLANVFSEAGPVANVEYVSLSSPSSVLIPSTFGNEQC